MAAIFAGNGVVLKCSEKVIWSTSWYVDIIKTCLQACGQDPELVQVGFITFFCNKCVLTLQPAFVVGVLLAGPSKYPNPVTTYQAHHIHWFRACRTPGTLASIYTSACQ